MVNSYSLTSGDCVLRTVDGALIPDDIDNRDWTAYQTWLNAGNTPDPAPTAPIPNISKRQMLTWLLSVGKSESDVAASLSSITDATARAQALIDWNFPDAPFQRSNPLFDQLGPGFGLSPSQMDAAFVAAALL